MKEKKNFWAGIEKPERGKFIITIVLMFLTQAILMFYLIGYASGRPMRCIISAPALVPGLEALK